MPACGLTLPCKQTIADKQDALSITNKLTGAALAGTSGGGPGVHGTNGAGSGLAVATVCGVWGDSDNAFGVHGTSKGAGVRGESSGGFGVHGSSQTNDGVNGDSDSGVGVRGTSNSAEGVRGESQQSDGVRRESSADGAAGVAAINRATGGLRNALFAHSDAAMGSGPKDVTVSSPMPARIGRTTWRCLPMRRATNRSPFTATRIRRSMGTPVISMGRAGCGNSLQVRWRIQD